MSPKGPGMQLILVRENGDNLARVEALNHAWQGNPRALRPAPGAQLGRPARGLLRRHAAGRHRDAGAGQITVDIPNGERFVFHINA